MVKNKIDCIHWLLRICIIGLLVISIWLFINYPQKTVAIKTETGEILTGIIVSNYNLGSYIDFIWNILLLIAVISFLFHFIKNKAKGLSKHFNNFIAITLQILVVYLLALALFEGVGWKPLFFLKLIITGFVLFLYSRTFIETEK